VRTICNTWSTHSSEFLNYGPNVAFHSTSMVKKTFRRKRSIYNKYPRLHTISNRATTQNILKWNTSYVIPDKCWLGRFQNLIW